MRKKWLEPADDRTPESFKAAIGGHALVAQVLYDRGLTRLEAARAFLDPKAFIPPEPCELPGIDKAADRIERAISDHELICVWGDFDVDGQTSTALLVSTLRELGAHVDFHIPVRERESHGVSLEMFKDLCSQRGFSLGVTCDTGITGHEAISYANTIGVDFVVTDHHELPAQLPAAIAIVNPRQLPPGHPSLSLPGVGTAYKLAQELYNRSGRGERAEKHLDLVALGIVADVAEQTGETRYLLQRGLETLRAPVRAGIKAIYEMAELTPAGLSEEHIAYTLAPRLNALGRLSDANPVVELLTTTDIGRARVLANHLEGLNARRKLLTDQVFQAVQSQIERDPGLLDRAAIVLSQPSWPAGVIGIVASRLVERYNQPVILFSAPPGGVARGSGRSIQGLNLTHAVAAQAGMLMSFGGHAMAAGLSLPADSIPEFRQAFCRTVEEMLDGKKQEPVLQIDSYLPLSDLTPAMVMDFERLAPFGNGNPPLTLASPAVRLHSSSTVGRAEEHLQLVVEDQQGSQHQVIWWQGSDCGLPEAVLEGVSFDLAYHVRMRDYRGGYEIQIECVDIREQPQRRSSIYVETPPTQVIDHRRKKHPLERLKRLLVPGKMVVWGEGETLVLLGKQGIPVQDRNQLFPASILVIWTSPPGRAELYRALKIVSPGCVHLFGLQPEAQQLEAFLTRLAGLIKYGLYAREGSIHISQLAAATAQREATVRKGLAWLEADGHIRWSEVEAGRIELCHGDGNPRPERAKIGRQLSALLEETSAFRRYFLSADVISLVESPPEE